MSNDMISMQEKALAADIRHNLNDKQQLHLDQIEMRIRDHRERFTLSLLEIGRCLNEAKEAKLVSHGHWQEWVAVNTGFTVRAAQRVMLAAREIPKTSTLTLLDFSKITPLLALPAEEREAFAADVDVQNMSVRQLDAAVREKLAAEQRAKEAEQAAEDAKRSCQQARDALEQANARRQALERQLDDRINNPEVVEVVPEDYKALKERDAAAAARIREAEDYADAQEERVRELQAKLDASAASGTAAQDDVRGYIQMCSGFYAEALRYQNVSDAALFAGKERADLTTMWQWAELIRRWGQVMCERLNQPMRTEVDGDVR